MRKLLLIGLFSFGLTGCGNIVDISDDIEVNYLPPEFTEDFKAKDPTFKLVFNVDNLQADLPEIDFTDVTNEDIISTLDIKVNGEELEENVITGDKFKIKVSSPDKDKYPVQASTTIKLEDMPEKTDKYEDQIIGVESNEDSIKQLKNASNFAENMSKSLEGSEINFYVNKDIFEDAHVFYSMKTPFFNDEEDLASLLPADEFYYFATSSNLYDVIPKKYAAFIDSEYNISYVVQIQWNVMSEENVELEIPITYLKTENESTLIIDSTGKRYDGQLGMDQVIADYNQGKTDSNERLSTRLSFAHFDYDLGKNDIVTYQASEITVDQFFNSYFSVLGGNDYNFRDFETDLNQAIQTSI